MLAKRERQNVTKWDLSLQLNDHQTDIQTLLSLLLVLAAYFHQPVPTHQPAISADIHFASVSHPVEYLGLGQELAPKLSLVVCCLGY